MAGSRSSRGGRVAVSQPKPSHTYQCRNRGCQSGGSFEAAPPPWWRETGLSEPSNCPSCREWKKSQADDDVSCEACGFTRRIPAGVKIMFHTNEGVWNPPAHCKRCTEDPEWRRRAEARARRLAARPKRSSRIQRVLPEATATAQLSRLDQIMRETQLSGIPKYALEIATSVDVYRRVKVGTETKHQHLLAPEARGGHRDSLMAASGGTSDGELVAYMSWLAHNTNHDDVYEFREASTTIAKVDRKTGFMLALQTTPIQCNGVSVLMPRTGYITDGINGLSKYVDPTSKYARRWSDS